MACLCRVAAKGRRMRQQVGRLHARRDARTTTPIEWTEYAGASSWPDFQAGDLDTGFPPPAEQAAAEADADLQSRYVERPGAALTYLGFPLYLEGPWQDIEFRKAISMAIDRAGHHRRPVPRAGVPADSWVVPGGVPGGEAGTCEWCTFDPEAAQAARGGRRLARG